jgi:LmbE family N-acetylglucosaminyl deacetylase
VSPDSGPQPLDPPPLPRTLDGPPEGRKVLVVAPHPDDETVGLGGTLALHARRGDDVQVVFATTGVHGDVSKDLTPEEYVALRQAEARAAAAELGLGELVFWPFPDSCVVTTQDLEHITNMMCEVYRSFGPDLVYAPHVAESHSDHHFVARAVEAAHRTAGQGARLLGYEVWTTMAPDLLVDVSPVYEQKRRAIACYASQLEHSDILGATEGMNRYRAVMLPDAGNEGTRRAEAFLELA